MALYADLSARFDAVPAPARAAFWITMAGFCFTVSMTAVRKVSVDMHVFESVMFRSLFGIAFMVPWLLKKGVAGIKTKRLGLFAIRGSGAYFVTYFYFSAAALIPLADLTSITFTRPILGTIAAIIFLKEVAGARRWSAIGVGFIGMLIIVRPGFVEVNLGVLLVLCGVMFQTCNTVIVKTLTKTEHPDTIVLYHTLFILPLSIIPAIYVWQTPTLEQWGWLAVIGAAGILTQRAMTRAFVAADASFVLAMSYLRLPIAAFVGFAFFGEVPEIWVWIGASVICASSAYIAHRESVLARAKQTEATA
ncbi:MAG: EamA family transporter [Alphaproteobacteria bacterium]|nr:EamA family transporter [Alphaproteobacteria bacterium]